MISLEHARLLTALALFGIASAQDLRTREVPDWIPLLLAVSGLALAGAEALAVQSILPVLLSAGMLVLCFAFAYVLYRLGAWAGGDVKLFTGLGAVLPSYSGMLFFPFLALAASALAVFPFLVLYVLAGFRKPSVRREFLKELKKVPVRSWLSGFILFAGITLSEWAGVPYASLVLVPAMYYTRRLNLFTVPAVFSYSFYLDPFRTLSMLSYSVLVSAAFILGTVSFRTARKTVLRRRIPAREAREGMIPAKDYWLLPDGRIITTEPSLFGPRKQVGRLLADSRSAAGLTPEQAEEIRRLAGQGKIKWFEEKLSIPFVPVFALGILLAALFPAVFSILKAI